MELLIIERNRKTLSLENLIKILGISFVTFIYLLIVTIDGYSESINKSIGIWALFLSIYLMYIYRKNIGLFIVMFFIAYTNYSVIMGVYFFPELRFGYYYQITSVDTYGKDIISIMLFEFFLAIFSLFSSKSNFSRNQIKRETPKEKLKTSNYVVAYGGMLLYLFAFFYGILTGRQIEDRLANTALKEYRTIFLIISLIYSKHNKGIRNCWLIIIAITSLIVFLGGSRADAFPSLFAFAVYYCPKWIKAKHILLLMIPIVIFMAAVGYFRTSFEISFDIFTYTTEKLKSDKLTYEGAIAGYFPSLAMIEITDVLSLKEKIYLLFKHIIYVVGGSKIGNPDLSEFSKDYFGHYNGFITPAYGYVWFGAFFGPLFIALLVQFYIHITLKSEKRKQSNGEGRGQYLDCLALYFLSTVARWYCYGPMGLLRGVFVFTCIYLVVYICSKIFKKV